MAEVTAYTHGTPCWVDATSTDLDTSLAFYKGLFGWEAETDPRPEANRYTMCRLNGKNVAGVSPPPQEGMPSFWTTYIASDDVDATAAKVTDAAGTVLMEPTDIFDSGRMIIANDPTGAMFGVWQAREHIGSQLANEPGSFNWNECHSPEPERAAAFYADVFDYAVEATEMGGRIPYRLLKLDGRGVGGVAGAKEGEPPNWATIFSVASCDDSIARVQELGGALLAGPHDIPDVGRFAVVEDPVGATFGVISPPAAS